MRNQFIFENEAQPNLQQNLNRGFMTAPANDVLGFRARRALRSLPNPNGFSAVSGLSGESEFENYEAANCLPFTPVPVEDPKIRRKDNRVSDKTIPDRSDIVLIQGAFAKTPLRRVTAKALEALVCAARADGIKHPILLPTGSRSGFRDPKLQAAAWERALKKYGSAKEANKWVARPGFSAHQSGRAIDFYLGIPNGSGNVARLRQTPAYKWMTANAHRFGFYPYPTEPWHWEYNPPAPKQSEFSFETDEAFEYESDFENETSALDVLSPSELKAVKITSTFETGRAGGFGGLTGNFDGQGLSFGLMNFTIKAGSLIPLLQEFINKFPARYAAIFGKDAERFKEIVFAMKPDPKNPKRRVRDVERQMEFVNKQMNSIPFKASKNKIVEPWKTYFGKLETDSEFRKIQVKAVRRALGKARKWFDYFGFKTERGLAFMFDLVSSHGGAWLDAPKFKGRRKALLDKMLAAKKAQLGRSALTELEKMEVIANMIADASLPEWREKARLRKLWFVRGIGKVHGRLWDIKKDFGITDNAPNFGNSTVNEYESEFERYYDNEEFELPKALTAPPLLKTEKVAQGETLYVKIGIGLGNKLEMTGIFIPGAFKPNSDFELIVYLHGHKGLYPGNSVLIDGYWNAARFPFFGLREEVAASGKNVIFVAPSLGSHSEAGSLIRKGGFDAYIEKVLGALNAHYFTPRHQRQIPEVRTIILAAHSGGGLPMLQIVKGGDRNAAKVRECWCYDSMYGAMAQAWTGWAKSHPQSKLFVYYGPAKGWIDPKTGKKRILPRDNAEAIACETIKSGLSNVCVEPSRAKSIGKAGAHFWVPKVHLKERLLRSSCSPNNVCPKRPMLKRRGI